MYPPTGKDARRAFGRFMSGLADRYKPGGDYWQGPFQASFPGEPLPVRTYQLFNEQNSRAHWGDKRPAPRAYARLVKIAGRAIKRQQPKAELVLGGMFAKPRGRGSLTIWRFLQRLYRVRGIRRAFDSVAVHPYAPKLKGTKLIMRRTRKMMRRSGHRAGGIRVTELGWGSVPSGNRFTKTPAVQARLLKRAFRIMLRQRGRKRWNVRGMMWFSWQDATRDCPFCQSSGLVSGPPRERRLKPSYFAFQQISP